MSIYSSDQITSVTVAERGGAGIVVEVRPRMESAFDLAGARIEETDARVAMRLVRCPVGSDCAVDLPAVVEPGGPNPYRITVPPTEKALVIVYANGVEAPLAR